MASSLAWFRKGYDPETIITLYEPRRSQWKILKKLDEFQDQVTFDEYQHEGTRSTAWAKFQGCDPERPANKVSMQVFVQIPAQSTEMDDAATRRLQALSWTPPQLTALIDLTEKGSDITPKLLGYSVLEQNPSEPFDPSKPVPGGFLIWLVWQEPPGLVLGEKNDARAFWHLHRNERDEVREAFLHYFAKLKWLGWLPAEHRARSLVWNRETKKVCFTGGFVETEGGPPRGKIPPAQRFMMFGLAIPDVKSKGWRHWDNDTSNWKW